MPVGPVRWTRNPKPISFVIAPRVRTGSGRKSGTAKITKSTKGCRRRARRSSFAIFVLFAVQPVVSLTAFPNTSPDAAKNAAIALPSAPYLREVGGRSGVSGESAVPPIMRARTSRFDVVPGLCRSMARADDQPGAGDGESGSIESRSTPPLSAEDVPPSRDESPCAQCAVHVRIAHLVDQPPRRCPIGRGRGRHVEVGGEARFSLFFPKGKKRRTGEGKNGDGSQNEKKLRANR